MQINKLLIHFTSLTINFAQLDMIMTIASFSSLFFNIFSFYCESPWFSCPDHHELFSREQEDSFLTAQFI